VNVGVAMRMVCVGVVRVMNVRRMLMRMGVRVRVRHSVDVAMRRSALRSVRLAHGNGGGRRRARLKRHARRPRAGARCSEQRLGAVDHVLEAPLLSDEVGDVPLELGPKSRALRHAVDGRSS